MPGLLDHEFHNAFGENLPVDESTHYQTSPQFYLFQKEEFDLEILYRDVIVEAEQPDLLLSTLKTTPKDSWGEATRSLDLNLDIFVIGKKTDD